MKVRRTLIVLALGASVLLVLGAGLCTLACWRFGCGPVYALTLWSCMYGFAPVLVFPFVLGVVILSAALAVRLLPRRLQVLAVVVAGCAALSGLWFNHLHYPGRGGFSPGRLRLDETRRWLWEHPPDGTNRAERRERMAVIQAACDQIGPDQYCEYYDSWYGKDWLTAHYDCAAEQLGRSREQLEQSYPAFYYLGQATEHAMDDIRRTRVEAGIAVWHVYNMGYVFKTADACFGIDVLGPGVERLADDLDFLLVSHRHGDHWHGVLEERMIRLGKPVLSRTEGMPGSTVVASGGERRFGSVRVRIDLGDHVCAGSRHEIARCRDSVLMFHVDCEDELGQYTVYHAGDGGNVAKMCPDKRVDVLIIHNSVPGQKAVRQLRPRMIFASHVMELGHSPKLPNFGRVPFEFAYRWSLRGLDEDQSAVLTWGERWLYPGTVIKAALETPQ